MIYYQFLLPRLECIEALDWNLRVTGLPFYTVKYYDTGTLPEYVEKFGKWIGLDKNIGYYMCYKILKDNIKITDKYILQCMNLKEKDFTYEREKIFVFEADLEMILC